jgi:hypothetical protein
MTDYISTTKHPALELIKKMNVEVSGTLDIEKLKLVASKNDRQALITYLSSNLTMLQEDREMIYMVLDKVINTNSWRTEDGTTLAIISALMGNSKAVMSEIVRISKIVAELSLGWASLDTAAENNSPEDLLSEAGDIHPEGFTPEREAQSPFENR